jgi:hypothetical protein
MTQTDNLPRAAAALLRAKPSPLDDKKRPTQKQKEKYTPLQPAVAKPNSPNPAPLLAQRVVTAPRAGDPMLTTRPANPRRCWLCEVRA